MHHVAHGARLVIIFTAPFNPKAFGHGDLNMVNMGSIPKWLPQRIGKSQCHKVLYRLFAKVMINAVNLAFQKATPQVGIERLS